MTKEKDTVIDITKKLILSDKRSFVIMIITALTISVVEVSGIVAIGSIISFYTESENKINNFIKDVAPNYLITGFILFYALRFSALLVLFNVLGNKIYKIKSQIISNFVVRNINIDSLDRSELRSFQTSISTDAQIVSEKYIRPMVMGLVEAFVTIGLTVLLVMTHLKLALLAAFGVLLLSLVVRFKLIKVIIAVGNQRKSAENESFRVLEEIIRNKNDYFRMNMLKIELKKFQLILQRRFQAEAKNFIYGKYPRIMLEFIGFLGLILLGHLIYLELLHIDYSIITVFAFSIFRLIPSLQKLSTNLADVMYSKSSIEKLFRDKTFRKEHKQKNIHKVKLNLALIDANMKNYTMELGRPIAVVGRSGIGKTYLAKSIFSKRNERIKTFYCNEDSKGLCKLDVATIDFAHRVAWYDKQTTIVSGNLIHNITLGSNYNESCLEEIKRICNIDFVEDNLNLGEVNLSEGQVQRILIARTLFGKADIVVLDEPTSALDENTANEILQNISKIKQKLVLLITHDNTLLSSNWTKIELKKKLKV